MVSGIPMYFLGLAFNNLTISRSSLNQVMILMMSMFGTAMPTLLSFPEERPVFLREYSTNHYGVVSYFMSRLGKDPLCLRANLKCMKARPKAT